FPLGNGTHTTVRGYFTRPALKVNETGQAVVSWEENDPISGRAPYIYATTFDRSRGWSARQTIYNYALSSFVDRSARSRDSLALDSQGRALTTWRVQDTSVTPNKYSVLLKRYSFLSQTWQAVELIGPSNIANTVSIPKIGANRQGDATVWWIEGSSRNSSDG